MYYKPSQTQDQKLQQDKIQTSMLQMTSPYIRSQLSESMFRGYYSLCVIFCTFFVFVYPILHYWDKGVLFSKQVIELLEANLILDLFGLIIFMGICFIAFMLPQQMKKQYVLQITFIGVILLCLHIIASQASSYSDRTFIVVIAWGYCGKLYSYFNSSDGSDTLKNKLIFLISPSLVYHNDWNQLRDKSLKINKFYILVKSLGAILSLVANCVIIIDFINPVIEKQEELSFLQLMFKLITPSFYLMIVIFYLVYESVFSGIAEFMRFKNRRFYSDWWNSENFYDLLEKSSTLPNQLFSKHIYEQFRTPLYLLVIELMLLQIYKKHFTFNAGILFLSLNFGVWAFGRVRNYFGLNNYLIHIAILCFMPFIVSLDLKYHIF